MQQLRVQNRLSFPDARNRVDIAASKVVGKTYVAVATAPKPIAKSVAINIELTWHSDDAKYKKLSVLKNKYRKLLKKKKEKKKGQNHNSE